MLLVTDNVINTWPTIMTANWQECMMTFFIALLQLVSLVPRPPPSFPSLAVLKVTESWAGSGNEATNWSQF